MGTTTTIGEWYEFLPGSVTRTHIFFGPPPLTHRRAGTRLATLEKTPVLIASVSPNSSLLTPNFLRRVYASIKHFLEGVDGLFVGTAYASGPTLPAGTSLYFYHGDHLGSVNTRKEWEALLAVPCWEKVVRRI